MRTDDLEARLRHHERMIVRIKREAKKNDRGRPSLHYRLEILRHVEQAARIRKELGSSCG